MSETAPAAAPTKPRRRVPFWDNARFACVVLVVVGHAVQRLIYDSDAALSLYLVVYAFHIPAFALISGYFSKSGALGKRQMARVITDILLPYLIFETLWTATKWFVEGEASINPTRPSWTLWFLLALGIFRLVLPYLALVRWPLLWAAVVSVGVGYLPNVDSTLSLSRTLGLLFFFTLGWWLREHDIVARWRLLGRRPWWLFALAIGVLGTAAAVAWVYIDRWRAMDLRAWMFYEDSYADLGGPQWWAGAIRGALMIVALVMSAAFFVLVPRSGTWWTHFGQYTMYVYLLHSFVLYPFRESGVLRNLDPTAVWLPIVVIASVAIALGLATAPVRRVFRPLVEPRWPWLFADGALAGSEGHRNDPTGSRRPATPPVRATVHPDPRQN